MTCSPRCLQFLEWHFVLNRNSINIYVMSKPLNIDDGVIFLYKKLMKIKSVILNLCTGSCFSWLFTNCIYQSNTNGDCSPELQFTKQNIPNKLIYVAKVSRVLLGSNSFSASQHILEAASSGTVIQIFSFSPLNSSYILYFLVVRSVMCYFFIFSF